MKVITAYRPDPNFPQLVGTITLKPETLDDLQILLELRNKELLVASSIFDPKAPLERNATQVTIPLFTKEAVQIRHLGPIR